MSEQVYVPDDERDAILDRLASQPENKVLFLCSHSRCVSTAKARTPSGLPLVLAFSFVTSAHQCIGTWACTSPS